VAHRGLRVLRSFLHTPPTAAGHQEPFIFPSAQTTDPARPGDEVLPEWATVIEQSSALTQTGDNVMNWNALFELDFDDLSSLQWPIDLEPET
jgi:hypothetical protein